jgi:fructose-1,6-bisphosphatase/inositol monophosphatase family enzyme
MSYYVISYNLLTTEYYLQGKNDYQTEADRAAQRCILASLHKQFPKVSIVGEEVSQLLFVIVFAQ